MGLEKSVEMDSRGREGTAIKASLGGTRGRKGKEGLTGWEEQGRDSSF